MGGGGWLELLWAPESRGSHSGWTRSRTDGGAVDVRQNLTVAGAGKKKNSLLNKGSGKKKRSWNRNLLQLLEAPASMEISSRVFRLTRGVQCTGIA